MDGRKPKIFAECCWSGYRFTNNPYYYVYDYDGTVIADAKATAIMLLMAFVQLGSSNGR